MPILTEEDDLWPEDAFEVVADDRRRWCVLYCRSRSEKALARQLKKTRIAYYLPVRKSTRKYQRRTVVASVPLFPGYLFALGTSEDREACRRFRECVGELPVNDEETLRRNLADLRRVLTSGLPVTREEKLQPGMLARITKGPLADLTGRVIRNRRGTRFLLEVQLINQGISIEIDGDAVEAI